MKFIVSIVMIALLCMQNDADAQTNYSSLTTGKLSPVLARSAVLSISYFNGIIKKDRVLLNWALDNNKETDRMEIERSHDGKKFEMIALVFASEQQDNAAYQFYEKLKKGKSFYRLKVIHKNNTIDYSATITPQP